MAQGNAWEREWPYPAEVAEILEEILSGVREALADNLLGVYLRGSLACGDFNPSTSDIDIFVVTWRRPDEAESQRLKGLHRRIAELPNPYAKRIEIAYIDRVSVRRFQPGQRHLTLEQGEGQSLQWCEHHENWLLERWIVREHGKTLYGPSPHTLIDPIPPEEIVRAVRARLKDWGEWAQDEDDPDWQLPRSHKAYVVETMCRALYALANGALASKPQAVAWAMANLPEPWANLVVRSQTWREDERPDATLNPEIRRFVLWVARGIGAR